MPKHPDQYDLSETEKLLILQQLPGFRWQDYNGALRAFILSGVSVEVVRSVQLGYCFIEHVGNTQYMWAHSEKLVGAIQLGYTQFKTRYQDVTKAIQRGVEPCQ